MDSGDSGSSVDSVDSGLRSRARGCLLGLGVGNLLGLPNEFLLSPRTVPLADIDPAELEQPWDDDLAQAFELAQALAEKRPLDVEDLAARLVRWARTNGRGMGFQTRSVIQLLERGLLPFAAARFVWERSSRQAAGNGGVMRVAPVGIAFHDDPEACARAAHDATAVTHCDPRCTQSAVAVAAGVAALLNERSALEGALAAVDAQPRPEAELLQALQAIPRLALEDLPIRSDGAIGYTVTCAAVGLWAAEQPGRLEELLLAVVNACGDADTNGAVAGALLGAKHGASAIPARWLERVRERAKLEQLAERLLER